MVRVFFLSSLYFQGRNQNHGRNPFISAKITAIRNVTLITKSSFMQYFSLSLEERTGNCIVNQITTLYSIVPKNYWRIRLSHVFPNFFLEQSNVKFSSICPWGGTLLCLEHSANLITESFDRWLLLGTKSIYNQINRNNNFVTKPVQSSLEFTLRLHWVHHNIAFIANEYLTALVASSRLMLSSKHSVSKEHTFKVFAS